MAERREAGSPCPLDGVASRERCRECRYFRGSVTTAEGTNILCNWPIDGSYRDKPVIPKAFREAFRDDG